MDPVELSLVIATAILAVATIVLASLTWLIAARARKVELFRRQLEEFYLPLLRTFRTTGFATYPETKPAEEARRILYEKYYLASEAVLDALAQAIENPPLTWVDWYFSTPGQVAIWTKLADAVNQEIQRVIESYGRAVGVKLPKWTLPPQWAFVSRNSSIVVS